MKTLIISLSAACAVVAGYFGIRYFTRQDLGFMPARKYVKNLGENLRHKLTVVRKAGSTPETSVGQAG